MKLTNALKQLGIADEASGFELLQRGFRKSLKLWSWFVDWRKVFSGVSRLEPKLRIWDELLGTSDFEIDCFSLLEKHPEIVTVIPDLIVREGKSPRKFSVASDLTDLTKADLLFDFSVPATSPELRTSAVRFMVESGLSALFESGGVVSLRDYMIGVEAGLNSNGRKNRSGTSMEDVVGAYLQGFCDSSPDVSFIAQATPLRVKEEFGLDIQALGKDRRFDFAVHRGGKLVLMEVNLYNSSGSKLDSIARSYPELEEKVKAAGHTFVWVTDGPGWAKSMSSLRAAHLTMDHLWNIEILYSGAIRELLN